MRIPIILWSLLVATTALAAPPDPPGLRDVGKRYIVKLKDTARGAQAVHDAGGAVALVLPEQRALAAYLPEQALRGLRNNPHVELVEEDPVREPLGEASPFGLAAVQANLLTDVAGADVTVCVIDSGYALGHEDLQQTNVTGSNDLGTGNWYEDTCGHGTHVAGTIAALANGKGVVGVNPNGNVHLHVVKVFAGGTDGCGWAYSSTLVAALQKCRDAGADVVNMSLGGAGGSTTEQAAFDAALQAGVLSFAAAGNAGTTAVSYPAGYGSVVSVAAVDEANAIASFSQQNSDVEVAGPGVDVLSTIPGAGSHAEVSIGTAGFVGKALTGAAVTTTSGVAGALTDGGLCTSVGAWSGKVVLCARGTNTFLQKVQNAAAGGARAALVANNVTGLLSGTLNGTSTIPAISLRKADGDLLRATRLGQTAVVVNVASDAAWRYGYKSGTSMATPHVVGVAALTWSNARTATAAQLREALAATAKDLGAVGRDVATGYGLVQAKAAADLLRAQTTPVCSPTTSVESQCENGADDDCDGAIDDADADCAQGMCMLGDRGAACVTSADCCAPLSCGGKRNRKTCR